MSHPQTDLALLKRRQREELLSMRGALSPEERLVKSERLCRRIAESHEYERASVVMLYKAFGSEASLAALEQRALVDAKRLVYPYCLDKGRMLALYADADTVWTRGRYGILTPERETAQICEPSDIDLVVCPCAGFDRAGNRLGMGGGYYDRFLPECVNARFVLAAFSVQELEAAVIEAHDVKMDAIVTDSEYIRIKNSF